MRIYFLNENIITANWSSEPRRHTVEMYASAITEVGLFMTLTFDLWP